jgi:hypothetical protein
MNPNQQQANGRKPTLQMPSFKQMRDRDEFTEAFVEMLNVMRRIHDLGGDPGIKEIITKAERALGRR